MLPIVQLDPHYKAVGVLLRAISELGLSMQHYRAFAYAPFRVKIHRRPDSNETPRPGQGLLQARRPFLSRMDSCAVMKNSGPLVQSIAQLKSDMGQQMVVHPRP